MIDNVLENIDFSNGIRSEKIQKNFRLIKEGTERERLRSSGYGIVEGFEITIDVTTNSAVVSEGVFINKYGQEISVAETRLSIMDSEAIDLTETLIVSDIGEVKLKYAPYVAAKKGNITNAYYQANYPLVDITILNADNIAEKIKALKVYKNTITVGAMDWANKKVIVNYKYARNRIDSILLDSDGHCHTEVGIMSSSPSHVDLHMYTDTMFLGFIETVIAETNYIDIFNGYKTFRNIYVDENNILYLNGKPYIEPQFIYFIEPTTPKPRDLYYDEDTNTLMIWREKDGYFGWMTINESDVARVRNVKIWKPDECPTDLQTFLFDPQELDINFIPGNHEVEIIIDQAVVMSDQFDEIVAPGAKPYLSQGIGFKLKNPLDKTTFVECRVSHSVKNSPLTNVFQRGAVFVDDGYVFYNSSNTAKMFTTTAPYTIGEKQLEVFVDGVRLERGYDFSEVFGTVSAVAADNGKMSNAFKISKTLTHGQKVTYKIEKHVWSYEHLNQMVEEIEAKADLALINNATLLASLNTLNANFAAAMTSVNTELTALRSQTAEINNCVKKTDKLSIASFDDVVKKCLYKGSTVSVVTAQAVLTVANANVNDLIILTHISATVATPMVKDVDYTIEQLGTGVKVSVESSLVSSANSIHIVVAKFGV